MSWISERGTLHNTVLSIQRNASFGAAIEPQTILHGWGMHKSEASSLVLVNDNTCIILIRPSQYQAQSVSVYIPAQIPLDNDDLASSLYLELVKLSNKVLPVICILWYGGILNWFKTMFYHTITPVISSF